MEKELSTKKIPFWRNKRVIPIMLQFLFVVLVVLTGFFFVNNALAGLQRIGIKVGFDFLSLTASFSIGEKLIEYAPTDSYGRAILVGMVNTVKVSIVGIILATVLGVFMGIARLSNNWLARFISGLYVEVVRNTPVLVQIFIWYLAIFVSFPKIQDVQPVFSSYFSNRGIVIPWFHTQEKTTLWLLFIVGGIILAIYLWKTKLKQQVETGERKYPFFWASGSFIVIALIAFFITKQTPFAWSVPTIEGTRFEGGQRLTPEFGAILFGLVFYTASYITEIVRGGIQAVSKGQIEAARALGLKNGTTLRLVTFPQAIRVIIPPVTSQYLNLAKNSSLAVAAGYPDLFNIGSTVINQSGRAVEVISIMMICYLSISLLTALFMNIYNRRMKLVER